PATIERDSRFVVVATARSSLPMEGLGSVVLFPNGMYKAPFEEGTTVVVVNPKYGNGKGRLTKLTAVRSSPFGPTGVPEFSAVKPAGALSLTIYGSATSAATPTLIVAVLVLPTLS